jgi:uncharacterized protein
MARSAFELSVQPTILTVPGLGGSGPSHWQTLWERNRPDTARIELGMWDRPHRNSWVTKIDQAVSAARAPVILVAHSLGCAAVAWWASLSPQPYGWPFAPVPKQPLPFPSIVVASTDDPWVTIERAHSLAVDWGSHFVDYGPHGHINAASGLGYWPEGLDLLSRVLDASAGPHGEARSPGDARAILAQPRAAHHEVRI